VEIKDINKLIDKINEKGITDFELEEGEFKLTIRKKEKEVVRTETVQLQAAGAAPVAASAPAPSTTASAPAAEAEIEDDNFHKVLSPMVGTFYAAPAPGAKPFVKVGDTISKGQVLCIVEAMKIMNEIQADVAGKIVKIHAKNEQPVEFDEPLFSVEEV
jgi:acetyl-CoA carboxylase biotin carboxyl carrier protein